MFFEITNKFLFYFQQGMQCLEGSVAQRACLTKVSFLAFLWALHKTEMAVFIYMYLKYSPDYID